MPNLIPAAIQPEPRSKTRNLQAYVCGGKSSTATGTTKSIPTPSRWIVYFLTNPNLFYIDEQEIITYTAGVMIEVAVLEFHALACQASWSLDAGISLNAAETSFRRFSTCRIFGSVC